MGQFISKMVKTTPVQITVNEKEHVEKEHVEKEHVEKEHVEKEDEVSIVCNNFIHE